MPLIVSPAGAFPTSSMTFGAATTDRADAACNNMDNLTKFSFLTLVKPTTLTDAKTLFGKFTSTGTDGWLVYVSGTSGAVGCFAGRTSHQTYLTSTIHLVLNRWTWIAVVRDQAFAAGTLWRLYSSDFNSEVWRTAAWGTATDGSGSYGSDSAVNAAIGNTMKAAPVDAFQGSIAFSAVYRELLKLHEFAQMVRSGDFQKQRALGLWYPGQHATVVYDVTGRGNNMAVTGGVIGGAPLAI